MLFAAKTDLAHLSVLGTSTVSPSKTHMQTKGTICLTAHIYTAHA